MIFTSCTHTQSAVQNIFFNAKYCTFLLAYACRLHVVPEGGDSVCIIYIIIYLSFVRFFFPSVYTHIERSPSLAQLAWTLGVGLGTCIGEEKHNPYTGLVGLLAVVGMILR